MYENWKIEKSKIWDYKEENPGDGNPYQTEYSAVAQWCNDHQKYTIVENGDYYEVQAIPEKTTEEKAENIRRIRDRYLQTYVDPVVTNPLRMADMSEEEKEEITQYRRYLLDITDAEGFPDIEILNLENWKAQNKGE